MSRQLKTKPYQSFRLSKKIKHPKPPLPSAIKLFRASLLHLKKHWRVFTGIVIVYLLLTVVLVKGFGINTGLSELKTSLEDTFGGTTESLATGFSLFTIMLTSSGSTASGETGLYQSIIFVITSLAVIWTLRQTYAKKKVKPRQAFYKGMYPLVPFLLVMGVIMLQLIPLMVGSLLYSAVIAGGVAVTMFELLFWWLLIGLLALLSFYMLTSSVFALYIVTLPDMTPMKALRSAREIVRYRRLTVMRKAAALPLLLLVIAAVIMVPLIIFVTPLAEWVFFVLNMTVLAVVHAYMYTLYRELL